MFIVIFFRHNTFFSFCINGTNIFCFWMHYDWRISTLCLCSHRSNNEWTTPKLIKISLVIFPFHLIISEDRLSPHRPVDHSVSTNNKSVFIELFEDPIYRKVSLTIKSVGFSRPVKMGAHLFYLMCNAVVFFTGKLSTLRQKFFSRHLFSCL